MTTRRMKSIRYIAWFFTFTIMSLIFFSSSQNGAVSSEASGKFILTVLRVFSSDFDSLPDIERQALIESLQLVVRKCAHFCIYFALGMSLMTAFFTYAIKSFKKLLWSWSISLIYAVFDEIHQTFVDGRAGTITDVLIDFLGAFTGVLIILIITCMYKHIKSRSIKKMRKRELMKRLAELVATVEKLNLKVKELTAENSELKKKIEALETANNDNIDKSTLSVADEQAAEADCFTVRVVDEVELSDSSDSEPVLSNDALEYGAAVIGKITVESARYCDTVSALGGSDLKDLLGLIMGKSEVCKNEILNIAISELSIESKREMIDSQFNEALEYFKSVSEQ